MNVVIIFERISKASLYLVAAVIPLWFLPFTQNVLAYQKQSFLLAFALVGVVSWLGSMVYEGEVRFRKSWVHVPVLGVVAAVGISTVFSSWGYGSFWGFPLDVGDSFLTVALFALFSFFVSQSVGGGKELLQVLGAFVVSSTGAVVFAMIQMKGLFLIPLQVAQSPGFNTLGTTNAVAIVAAALLPLAVMLAAAPLEGVRAKAWKGTLGAAAGLLFLSLVVLNFSTAWVIAIAGLAVLFAFDALTMQKRAGKEEASPKRISLPMLLVLFALFFVIVDVRIPGAPERQPEVSPSYRGEFAVLRGVISESPGAIVVGTGPGTFVLDYAKHRLPELNQTLFWSTRFESGAAEILDWIITKGTLGLLALGSVVGLGAWLVAQRFMRNELDALHAALATGLLASLAGFAMSMFLYPANFILWFVFWMLVGGIAFVVGKETRTSLAAGPSFVGLGASFGFMVVVVFGIGLLFVGGQKYYAEAEYLQGVQAQNQGESDTAIAKIESAAQQNSSVDVYWRTLAQLYLDRASEIANNQSLSPDVRQQQTGTVVNKAIEAAQRAVEVSPANVANWNVRGFVYRGLIGVPGAEERALESYRQARLLEPVSPFPWTESGRVRIASAQAAGSQNLEEAIADLQKAIDLKPDYAPAHYLLSLAYDQQGNQAEAIAKLEETRLVAPQDVGLAFQLGVMYYRQDELGKARDEFERAKLLNPRYSNARYMLGLVYDRLGRKADARVEFAAVLAANPDNRETRDILENLAAGRPALDGIGQPNTPPVQETAPEGNIEE